MSRSSNTFKIPPSTSLLNIGITIGFSITARNPPFETLEAPSWFPIFHWKYRHLPHCFELFELVNRNFHHRSGSSTESNSDREDETPHKSNWTFSTRYWRWKYFGEYHLKTENCGSLRAFLSITAPRTDFRAPGEVRFWDLHKLALSADQNCTATQEYIFEYPERSFSLYLELVLSRFLLCNEQKPGYGSVSKDEEIPPRMGRSSWYSKI